MAASVEGTMTGMTLATRAHQTQAINRSYSNWVNKMARRTWRRKEMWMEQRRSYLMRYFRAWISISCRAWGWATSPFSKTRSSMRQTRLSRSNKTKLTTIRLMNYLMELSAEERQHLARSCSSPPAIARSRTFFCRSRRPSTEGKFRNFCKSRGLLREFWIAVTSRYYRKNKAPRTSSEAPLDRRDKAARALNYSRSVCARPRIRRIYRMIFPRTKSRIQISIWFNPRIFCIQRMLWARASSKVTTLSTAP